MKKFFYLCLLGTALLQGFAANATKAPQVYRVVNCYIEQHVLFSTSDDEDGPIKKVEVYNTAGQLVATELCSGYLCMVDISHLPAGRYTVKVTTANGVQYRTVVK